MIIVDAGTGKVLSNLPIYGSSFGMMGNGMMGTVMMGNGMMGPGMMMYRGTPYPNVITNTTGARIPSGMIVHIVSGAQILDDKAFQPDPINIKVGNTVAWVNDDTTTHTVTSGTGPNDPNVGSQFDSRITCTRTNYCAYLQGHGGGPSMIGTVIVK
jgi:plastocyanin